MVEKAAQPMSNRKIIFKILGGIVILLAFFLVWYFGRVKPSPNPDPNNGGGSDKDKNKTLILDGVKIVLTYASQQFTLEQEFVENLPYPQVTFHHLEAGADPDPRTDTVFSILKDGFIVDKKAANFINLVTSLEYPLAQMIPLNNGKIPDINIAAKLSSDQKKLLIGDGTDANQPVYLYEAPGDQPAYIVLSSTKPNPDLVKVIDWKFCSLSVLPA